MYLRSLPLILTSLLVLLAVPGCKELAQRSMGEFHMLLLGVTLAMLLLAAMLMGMIVNGFALVWLISNDVYLAAFPQAMLIGRVAYLALVLSILAILCGRDKARPPQPSDNRE